MLSFRSYKNFIFDFDMTLVDTSKGSAVCYAKAFEAAGALFESSNLTLYMSEFLDATFRKIKNPLIDYSEFEKIFYQYSHQIMAQEAKLFSDTKDALMRLSGKNNLAIVTNKDRFCVEQIMHRLDFPVSIFDVIVCCDDVKNKKPDPEPLNFCISKMNWSKNETIYVGDNETDQLFASNAGIHVAI